MSERKKGSGYEDVKQYLFDRLRERECPEDPFVRITGQEIAEATGITSQTANEHVRTLVQRRIIYRERRYYFSLSSCGNLPTTFPEPSENLPATCPPSPVACPSTFSEPSENLLRTFSEGCDCSKKEYQEKTNKTNKEKCVDFLGDWVDVTEERFVQIHAQALKLFNRYGAGIRKGTSPALINRFCAGLVLEIPLITFPELEEQLKEAEQETALFESFKGFGKQSGIRRPYIRIANYLKKCFEAAGWVWTPCTSPFEFRLKKAHKHPKATPVFPQLEPDIKPQAGSALLFGDRLDPMQAENARLSPAVGKLAESLGINGKKPPDS